MKHKSQKYYFLVINVKVLSSFNLFVHFTIKKYSIVVYNSYVETYQVNYKSLEIICEKSGKILCVPQYW